MPITMPKTKPKPPNAEAFISAAPDAVGTDAPAVKEASPVRTLKAKRGTSRSQVSVVLADELVARIDEQADKSYMSRSAYITMALNKFLAGTG
jgi:hypothetical protein